MFKTQSLRELVSNYLLDKLCEGTLEPGEKLNIAFLARELGVSPTPLREALFGLSEKGVIAFIPNKGFKLKSLRFNEANEIYQIISNLDGLALRTSNKFNKAGIRRLFKLLDKVESDAALERVSFDSLSEFENGLVANCTNERLMNMCKELRIHTFPYEQLMLKQAVDLNAAFSTHRQIIALLEKNDVAHASALLSETWMNCLPELKNLLEVES